MTQINLTAIETEGWVDADHDHTPLYTFWASGTRSWFDGPRHGRTRPMGLVTSEDVASYVSYGQPHRLALYLHGRERRGGWAWIATPADIGPPPASPPPHAVRVATTDAEAAAAGRAAALRDGVSGSPADAVRTAFLSSLEMVGEEAHAPASGLYAAFIAAYFEAHDSLGGAMEARQAYLDSLPQRVAAHAAAILAAR